ncbi:MAG TPA: hypothetical protein VLD37_02335 [Candidatus Bilamarchaeum sp.]|nr:hypothetical protein [Candidatus Bilamarchaeum sp.]
MRLLLLAAILLAAPVVFADVGPSPEPPQVVVHMVKDGNPDSSVESITYNCMGETGDDGAVSQRQMDLGCSAGTCTNSAWFYKFNPCFSFPGGTFSYEYGGERVESDSVGFNDSFNKYEITIDAPSGRVQSKLGSSLPGCCGSGFIIGAVLAGAAFARKR